MRRADRYRCADPVGARSGQVGARGLHGRPVGPARSAEQLGAALKRLRKKVGLSQIALGKKAGLRQGTVSKVENGAKNTEIATIYSICAALGLELVVRDRGGGQEKDITELFT